MFPTPDVTTQTRTDHLTQFLAAWGATLSTLGFGWTLRRDLRDRAYFKVTARIRRFAQGVGGNWYSVAPDLEVDGASEELFVVVTVVNIGRRPLKWEGW